MLEQDPRPDVWEGWSGSVLLSDEIEYYSTDPAISSAAHLISPFRPEQLGAARYNLSLGSEVRRGGQPITLDEEHPWLELEPYQNAIVQTYEQIRLPRFLIARWNFKVSMVYEGLLWTGALQVDPGWHGHLYCPIYNLADRSILLKYKQEIFAMDFVRTTKFYPNVSIPYDPKRGTLDEYDRHRLRSAPHSAMLKVEKLESDMESLRSESDSTRSHMLTFSAAMITALTIIVALIAIFFASPELKDFAVDVDKSLILSLLAIGVSSISLVINFWNYLFRTRKK